MSREIDPARRGRSQISELERLMRLRARLNPAFVAALKEDFAAHGHEAIAYARISRSATYLKLSALCLPGVVEEEAAEARAKRDARMAQRRAARDKAGEDGGAAGEDGGGA